MNSTEITQNTDVPSHFRSIKTFVLRTGRMTEGQKRNYEAFYQKWCIPYTENPIGFKTLFQNDNPVIIEIGFGMGTATAQIAEDNPDKNYLGIEVFKAGVGKLLGEIEEKKLNNVRIIEHDAIEVLENMINDESIDSFHIFFPDPWQKKRNHKRRLVRRPRTDLLSKRLKKGGYIYMVTDWENYAEDAFEQLRETPNLKSKYEKFAPSQSWRPTTKFEKKGLKKEHVINELIFEKE
ncbi:tRNA (guanosine(46)-N7)-methyltransferase TrmB [Treponema putidum]|uniref:tRNA (guanosine(46)-N7)-methyltransferase TrmB n=1 Tax=Treponema putidum TaxID=221027 RepID=UPI0009FDFBEF|nr:tRNA (guanosine(46)-N7)-methyltransferase TrmB [Treponema putidum]